MSNVTSHHKPATCLRYPEQGIRPPVQYILAYAKSCGFLGTRFFQKSRARSQLTTPQIEINRRNKNTMRSEKLAEHNREFFFIF